MTRLLTDRQARKLGLDPKNAVDTQRILDDTSALYQVIDAQPWVRRSDVQEWAESRWGAEAPDRLNAALEVMLADGQVVEAPDPGESSVRPLGLGHEPAAPPNLGGGVPLGVNPGVITGGFDGQ